MANSFPSMTALLGLLAVAGYQNRDKLGELLGGAGQGGATSSGQAAEQGGLGGILGNLARSIGGGGAGGLLSGGISDLVERFRQSGHGAVSDSWVQTGPNQQISPQTLEQAIGPDVLANLTQQTGLPREELLARLSQRLP